MHDLINRQAAIDALGDIHPLDYNGQAALEKIKALPSAEKVGKWIEWWPGDCALIMTGEEMLWMCSECTAKFSDKSSYCPNCGADMRGKV